MMFRVPGPRIPPSGRSGMEICAWVAARGSPECFCYLRIMQLLVDQTFLKAHAFPAALVNCNLNPIPTSQKLANMAEITIKDTDLKGLKGKVVVITGMEKINPFLEEEWFLTGTRLTTRCLRGLVGHWISGGSAAPISGSISCQWRPPATKRRA